MKNVLIVEDKIQAAEKLKYLIATISKNIKIYIAYTAKEAYTYVMEEDFDLFLIDIILDTKKVGDVSGIQIARKIRTIHQYQFVPVIMITSLEDPKLYSYSELHCYSYVEKPYDSAKIKKLIEEALEYRKSEDDNNKRYLFKKEGIMYAVDLDTVIYIESIQKKVEIVTINETIHIPYISMKKLLKELRNKDFLQCSRFYIINRNYIESVDRVNRYITLENSSKQIEIGGAMKKKFMAEITNAK